MKVLSIDIGIKNLGYVFSNAEYPEINSKFKSDDIKFNINVIECNRVDITNMTHNIVKCQECKLHHERCIPDYLDHFIQDHREMFETADIILLERQPPVGILNVQDILFMKFRSKILLVNPRSVHLFFKMSKDYDTRKLESERIASEYLGHFDNFLFNQRKHDMADAVLMILHYCKCNVVVKKTKGVA